MRASFNYLIAASLMWIGTGVTYKVAASFNSQDPVTTIGSKPDSNKQLPLTSVIGADASMSIQPNEVMLGKMRGLVVEVRNNTDRPLLFDGDHATATISGSQYTATPVSSISDSVTPDRTKKQVFEADVKATVTATVTVGAVQAIEGVRTQAKPVLERYGADEVRRQDEIARFGKRIVWPGDNTRGTVYFSISKSLKGASVAMPVQSMFFPNDQTSLTKSY
jgi:hypothetical protein